MIASVLLCLCIYAGDKTNKGFSSLFGALVDACILQQASEYSTHFLLLQDDLCVLRGEGIPGFQLIHPDLIPRANHPGIQRMLGLRSYVFVYL